MRVNQVMSPQVKVASPMDTLQQAARITAEIDAGALPVTDVARNMAELQLRRLPVVDCEKRLVGIVALADLSTRAQDDAREALRGVWQSGGRHSQSSEK
jgi:CBS-domain-containing membrane protein